MFEDDAELPKGNSQGVGEKEQSDHATMEETRMQGFKIEGAEKMK